MVIGNDCLRTHDFDAWRNTIVALAVHVPVIVLDARDSTPALVYEARSIFSRGDGFKTIFIMDDDKQAPVLDEALAEGLRRNSVDIAVGLPVLSVRPLPGVRRRSALLVRREGARAVPTQLRFLNQALRTWICI